MTERPLISLSIVSHGNADEITRLLVTIQQHEPDAKKIQIILTDNLGNDLPDYDPKPWAALQIIRNDKPRGLAYNNNRAFDISKGAYFGVVNPDLLWNNALIDPLISIIRRHHIDIVAPQIIDIHGNVQDSYRTIPTLVELIKRRMPGYQFKFKEPDGNGFVHPDWIAGMFWFMPASTYKRLNGMDEKFKLYFEDVDFCTRAHLQGMNLIVDTNHSVVHDAQRSSRSNLYYLLMHLKSAVQFFVSPVYRQARKRSQPK